MGLILPVCPNPTICVQRTIICKTAYEATGNLFLCFISQCIESHMRETLYDNYHMRKWKCASCCAKDKTFDRKLFESESSFQSQLPHHCHDHNQHWVMNHSQSDWSWKVCKSSQGGGFCTISDANQHRNPASSSWSWWSWSSIQDYHHHHPSSSSLGGRCCTISYANQQPLEVDVSATH